MDWGFVSYSDNNQGKILGKGVVGNPSTTTIKDVTSQILIQDIKPNLIFHFGKTVLFFS